MKNVLFIVYYFPPMGGSGVQRPLKFAKYLREFGWNPIILCPEPGAYQFFDKSLEKEFSELDLEIHRVKANTPFHSFGGAGKSTGLITGWLAKFLRKLSRKIYFPDNKKGWIKPAVDKAKEIISEENIDLIFSTAPPFSNHIIGQKLKSETGIPLVVDYRDLFLGNHFDQQLKAKEYSRKKELESSWLKMANGVTVLDNYAEKTIFEIFSREDLLVKSIPHGFDLDNFNGNQDSNLKYQPDKLNFLYSGLFYESNQPDAFLKAWVNLFEDYPEVKSKIALHFQGGLDSRIKKLINEFNLEAISFDYGYLNHSVAAANLQKADVLWMISNFDKNLKQIKSGKLFEYTGTKKIILGLVHHGAAVDHLNEYGAGFWAKPGDTDDIKKALFTIYQNWEDQNLPKANEEYIAKFNRKKLTEDLANLFNEILAAQNSNNRV